MEINITESLFSTVKSIYNNTVEQPIETDFTMPDYYPEISKTLKCCAEVSILSKQIKDKDIILGGQVKLTLYYVDPDNKLNTHTHIFPFTKSVEISSGCEKYYIKAKADINCINTKAVSPRKVEVRGSIYINICVDEIVDEKIISEIAGDSIYTENDAIKCSEIICPIVKNIFLEDDVSINQGDEAISKLIMSDSKAKISDFRLVNGKLIAKGEVLVKIVYLSDESEKICILNDEIAFSQVIDADGFDDFTEFSVFVDVLSLEAFPKSSLNGEINTVNVETKLEITVFPRKSAEVTVIKDAFSGQNEAELSFINIVTECFQAEINEKSLITERLEFSPESLCKVYDIWGKLITESISAVDNEIKVKGKVKLNILGVNADNEPSFFDRTIDVEYSIPSSEDIFNSKFKENVQITCIEYNLSDNGYLEINVEISTHVIISSIQELKVISAIKIDNGSKICKDCETAVILYFAENETVWDIAKKYCTSPKRICEVNSISGYKDICNRMLLIPNV